MIHARMEITVIMSSDGNLLSGPFDGLQWLHLCLRACVRVCVCESDPGHSSWFLCIVLLIDEISVLMTFSVVWSVFKVVLHKVCFSPGASALKAPLNSLCCERHSTNF